MVRKSALVTAMLGAFASQSFALGLGDIRLNSALNQPLDAEVELLSPTPKELNELRVTLAPPEAYRKAGLERVHFHTRMRFSVEKRPDGSAVVRITTRDPVREPFLDFLLEASWSAGQVIREYTVLVDPPVLMPAPAPATQAATTTAPAPRTEPRRAAAPQPAVRAPRMTARAGEYGPTRRNDTLWRVAEQVRPDGGVTMEQTMLALLEANPEAFSHGNINYLKAGYVLRIPSREEMTAISQAEARREVSRQNRLWREGRASATQAARSGTIERKPAATGGGAAAVAPEAPADAQLKLVAPDKAASASAGAGTGGEAALDDVRSELAVAVEAVQAQQQQNQELSDRLAQLEAQIAQLHRLIQLKDQELARLQGGVAGQAPVPAGETPAGTAPAEAVPETAAESPAVAPEPETPATAARAPEAQPGSVPPSMEEEIVEETSAQVADEGLVAKFMNNPLWQAGAALVVVLIGLFAWLGGRRRRMEGTDFQESILAGGEAPRTPAPATPAPATAAAAGAAAVAGAAEQAGAPAETTADQGKQETPSDSTLFTDFSVSDMGAIQNEAEADPIAEADVYLAYGRFQQAEELIKSAIEAEPERIELRGKLLEIYHAARNVPAFDAEAEALAARLAGAEDPVWDHVMEMGRELNPGNPLYGGEGAEAAATPEAPEAEPEASTEATDALEMLEGLEVPGSAGEEAAPAEEEDNSLEFSLEGLESFGGESESPESEAAAPADEGLDFQMDESPTEDLVSSATEEIEEALGGEGSLATSDEVATKLDLARAYVEMGDPEGARSILSEVLDEGNEDQRKEAQALLDQLG